MNDAVALWAEIWKWVLIGGSAGFSALLLYTMVRGAGDIRRLVTALRKRRDEGIEENLH